jgi:hypothetical protein
MSTYCNHNPHSLMSCTGYTLSIARTLRKKLQERVSYGTHTYTRTRSAHKMRGSRAHKLSLVGEVKVDPP